jgi:hypothetical protein
MPLQHHIQTGSPEYLWHGFTSQLPLEEDFTVRGEEIVPGTTRIDGNGDIGQCMTSSSFSFTLFCQEEDASGGGHGEFARWSMQ